VNKGICVCIAYELTARCHLISHVTHVRTSTYQRVKSQLWACARTNESCHIYLVICVSISQIWMCVIYECVSYMNVCPIWMCVPYECVSHCLDESGRCGVKKFIHLCHMWCEKIHLCDELIHIGTHDWICECCHIYHRILIWMNLVSWYADRYIWYVDRYIWMDLLAPLTDAMSHQGNVPHDEPYVSRCLDESECLSVRHHIASMSHECDMSPRVSRVWQSDASACLSVTYHMTHTWLNLWAMSYGVALVSRLHKTIGFFCKRAL